MPDNPLVPNTPTIDIDYDKYGHCALCHKNLMETKITSDGPVEMFSPEHSEVDFLLNDGSQMRVCVCKTCQNTVDVEAVKDELMRSVYKGWYIETQYLVEDKEKKEWDEARRQKYLYDYLDKEIVCKTKGLSVDAIEKKFKKYRSEKINKKIG